MKKRNNWFWNLLIVLTLVVCTLAFVAHYKNWARLEEGSFRVLSGFYHQKIPQSSIIDLQFVDKMPHMERKHGFSWQDKEKGIFVDSITGSRVHVFVDNLEQQKIRMVHHDSLVLFFNLADSIETLDWYQTLKPTELLPD
ncbi:MAG: hypothetical protein AAGF77_10775 [Bacteroidota bacterium]